MQAEADPTGILHTTFRAWEPDSNINQTDADITLMMLNQNDIAYLERSDDPWMTAQLETDTNQTIPGTNTTLIMWSKSYEINLLGCVDQYQVCNPNKPGNSACTTLGGIMSAVNQAWTTKIKTLDLNEPQIMTVSRFLTSATDKSMYSNVYGRGGAALNGKFRELSFIKRPFFKLTVQFFHSSFDDGLPKYSNVHSSEPMAN